MSLGTANYRLLRRIVFQMTVETCKDVCYHCGLRIEEKDFSVEHKKPWLHVSADLFWDLDNIAFSHRKCNSGAARQINKHGTKLRSVGPDGTSWCTEHRKFLPVEQFGINRHIWNGFQRQCKMCRRKRNKSSKRA
jgi:hypothetical protein